MSLRRDTAMDLMALADGELEGEAKVRSESLLRVSTEARDFVKGMQRTDIATYLQIGTERRAASNRVDAIAQTVMARLREDASSASPPRVAAETRSRLGQAPGRQRRLGAAVAVGAALAMAAAVGLYIGRGAGVDARLLARTDQPRLTSPVAQAEFAQTSGVQVDEIDSPTHDISVFEISGSALATADNVAQPSSVVIWVEDGSGSQ